MVCAKVITFGALSEWLLFIVRLYRRVKTNRR